MPGPSRRAALAQFTVLLNTHLNDTAPHGPANLVSSPDGGRKWFYRDSLPEVDNDDPTAAHEGDRLTLEVQE